MLSYKIVHPCWSHQTMTIGTKWEDNIHTNPWTRLYLTCRISQDKTYSKHACNVRYHVQKIHNVILNSEYTWLVLTFRTSLQNKSEFINSIDCDMALHSWKQTEISTMLPSQRGSVLNTGLKVDAAVSDPLIRILWQWCVEVIYIFIISRLQELLLQVLCRVIC